MVIKEIFSKHRNFKKNMAGNIIQIIRKTRLSMQNKVKMFWSIKIVMARVN